LCANVAIFRNAIERLRIEHPARDIPKASNLHVDLVALTAHEWPRIRAS
jgi:hypothetical protein